MSLLLAAAGALLLSILAFLPLDAETLRAISPYRELALAVLCLYFTVRSALLLRTGKRAVPSAPPPEPKPAQREPGYTGEALILLSLLQEKGRFLDFVSQDISAYNDAQVAAASRVVHQGCTAVIREALALSPAHSGKEGETITVEKSADPHLYRLLGKVIGEPPYRGKVVHCGWKTSKLKLPRYTRAVDPASENVITPIEVEVR